MEWAVLFLFAVVAAVLVGGGSLVPAGPQADADALLEARERLLQELRDLDTDAAAGRISNVDRREGRVAIAPELRLVTEQLRATGDSSRPLHEPEGSS